MHADFRRTLPLLWIAFTCQAFGQLAISPTSLPNGTVGVAYNQTVTVTGGTGNITWTFDSGTLPPGLAAGPATPGSNQWVISGSPTFPNTSGFTVRATDSSTPALTTTRSYTITINPAASSAPSVNNNPLPQATATGNYSSQVTATGGTGLISWSVTPSLPSNLTLSQTTGAISGIPAAASTANYTFTATDANQQSGSRTLELRINPAPSIQTASLPAGTPNVAYNTTLQATPNTGTTPLTWTLQSGTLPASLNFSAVGVLSGTPQSGTPAGGVSLTFRVTDANGVFATRTLNLVIGSGVSLQTASLPSWTVGQAYNQPLSATGGTSPYTFSVPAGALPTGLQILPGTSAVTGTPTTSGTFNSTIQVTDAGGLFDSKQFSVTINPAIQIQTASLPGGTVGVNYSQTLTATGGTGTLTWSIPTGGVPGLQISTSGVLSGIPSTQGSHTVTVQATDAVGATATRTYTVNIGPGLTITTQSLPQGVNGQSYPLTTLVATGGTGTGYRWSVASGTLPPGLTLAIGGQLSGVPVQNGNYTFTVQVADSANTTGSRQFTIAVLGSALTILTNSPLPDALLNSPYFTTLAASGGGGTSYTFTLTGGALPSGVNLTAAGAISGTPTQSGVFSFVVEVSDGAGSVASKPFTLSVGGSSLAITSIGLPSAVVGQPYSTTLTAIGGRAPYNWSILSGQLPAGLSLASTSGLITGTPSTAGQSSFRVEVRDANNATVTADLSIQVAAFFISTTTLANAGLNQPYTAPLAVAGGTAPYAWSIISGALPGGFSLDPQTGVISGTGAQAGTFTFTVQVRDRNNATATRALSLRVGTGLTIVTQALPAASIGVPYNFALQATGASGAVIWSVTNGALPPGLTLNGGTGIIAGAALSSIGSPFNLVISAADSSGARDSKPFVLEVSAALNVTTPALATATPGTPYVQTLEASGGTPPYTWILVSGPLPPGLVLSTAGTITGTPTQTGSFAITVRVSDSAGASGTRSYTLPVGTASSLTILTTSMVNGSVGVAYSQLLSASGGSGALTWSLAGGQLPPGLVLAPNGSVAGTPTAAGTFSFTVQATDAQNGTATRQLAITINQTQGLTILTTALPNGSTGVPYSQALSASGGTGALAWSLASGQLPPGLTITPAGGIAGVPTTAGTFAFTVIVSDSQTPPASAQRPLSVTIGGGLSIVNTTLPNATPGAAYSTTLIPSGGTAPYTWLVATGQLPPGLTLVPSTGLISGVATALGSYTFTIRLQDAAGATTTRQLSLQVGASSLAITTTFIPSAAVGTAYTTSLLASGGVQPYVWSLSSGQLPLGVGLTASTGVLTGVPTVPGNYNFTAQVSDGAGATVSRTLTLAVNPGLSITSTTLPGGSVGVAYSALLGATGGSGGGYVWSLISGSLPPGLTLTSSGGFISGTPTANGTSQFTLQLADSANATTTRQFSITVGTALSITTTALSNGAVGVAYNQILAAAGGSPPLTWSVTAGSLPPGLVLNAASGALAGTPSGTGSFTFTVRVQDNAGAAATRQVTVAITDGLTITTGIALAAATEGTAYSLPLAASGGTAPYVWSLVTDTLPRGLSLSPTGVISGTPAERGNYSFIVQVTDAGQQSANKVFTLAVGGRTAINITTPTTLPGANVRSSYAVQLTADGGSAPYVWSLSPGSALPIGLALEPSGLLSGSPTSAGTFNFSVQIVDSQNNTSLKAFVLTVQLGVAVVTPSPLPAAIAGTPYVQSLNASGGQSPYTWTIVSGALPAGLTLNQSGVISGTPAAAGVFNITVQVSDARSALATASLSVTVRLPGTPAVTITGLAESVEPAQQPRLNLALGSAFPLPVTGTLTMTFTPDAAIPADDPAVVFANGRRTMNFSVDANATQAQFAEGAILQTGTVAGTITLAVALRAGGQDITPTPAPQQVARVNRAAPVIRTLVARRVATGLEVEIIGYATTREVTQAVFRFTPSPGSTLQTSELSVPLTESARTWYQSEQSRPFGSQFTLTQRFNVTGDTSAISSVTVTLANGQGTSQAATATFTP